MPKLQRQPSPKTPQIPIKKYNYNNNHNNNIAPPLNSQFFTIIIKNKNKNHIPPTPNSNSL
jgi:hypothetical protein